MYLLDAPVVVALRKARTGSVDAGMSAWAVSVQRQSLFLSVLTLYELEGHAAVAARHDKAAGDLWRRWIDDQIMRAFDGRILGVDAPIVRRAAELDYSEERDALLAATALVHGMTLVTFRARAFKSGRVRTFDPVGYIPKGSVEDWRQAARAGPGWIKNLFVRN
jgi:predicted nucleic acid-binding protein